MSLRGPRLAVSYVAFAAAATAANLGTQHIVRVLSPSSLQVDLVKSFTVTDVVSLATGTAVGLILKFLLDSRFIFGWKAPCLSAGVGRFGEYTLTGCLTTVLFWGVELAFIRFVPLHASPYIGGAVGLSMGYALKYLLDRQFVFPRTQEQSPRGR